MTEEENRVLTKAYENRQSSKATNIVWFLQNRDDRDGHERAIDSLLEKGMIEMVNRMHFSLTDRGETEARALVSPSHQSIHIQNAINSPIQQGINSTQHQTINYQLPPKGEIEEIIGLLERHLPELGLDELSEKTARAQIATAKAQMIAEPNPTILKETFRTFRNVAEGAIGSLVATGVLHWEKAQAFLMAF